MKSIIVVIICLVASLNSASQTAMNFNKTFGGNLVDDPIKTFNVNGKVFVFGNITTPTLSGSNIGTGYGGNDYAMVIYNNSGTILKKQCFGGSREDKLLNVILIDSVFHLLGYSYSDNGQGKNASNSVLVNDLNPLFTYKYQEIYIVQIDFDGNIVSEDAFNLTDAMYINKEVGDWKGIGDLNEQHVLVPYRFIERINAADYNNGYYKFNINLLDTVRKRTDQVWRYTGPCSCDFQNSFPTKEFFTIDRYLIGMTANVDLSVRVDFQVNTLDRIDWEDLTNYGVSPYSGSLEVQGYRTVYSDSVPPCMSLPGIGNPPKLCTTCCGWPHQSSSPHTGEIWAYDTYYPQGITYSPTSFFPSYFNNPPYRAKFAKNEFILFRNGSAVDNYCSCTFQYTYNNMICPHKTSVQPPSANPNDRRYTLGTRVKDCVYNPNTDRYYSFTEFNNNPATSNVTSLYSGYYPVEFRNDTKSPGNGLFNRNDIWVTEHVDNVVNGFRGFSMIRESSVRAMDNVSLNNVSNVFDTNKVFICLSTAAGIGFNKTAPAKGGLDYWLIKFNLDKMIPIWDTTFGGQQDDILKDADVNNGGVTLTGRSYSSYGSDKTDNSFGNGDIWTLNYCLPPKINFSANKVNGAQGDLIKFNNYTINGFNYTWDFGDNAYSYLKNPEHFFNNNGLHNVKLTASQGNCSNSLIKSNYINISSAVSVTEISKEQPIIIYPNPSNVGFNVDSKWYINKVMNSIGKEIIYEIKDGILLIDDVGIYFIELKNSLSNNLINVKVIVYE